MYFEGICFNELFDVFVSNSNANMSQTSIQTSQMNYPFFTKCQFPIKFHVSKCWQSNCFMSSAHILLRFQLIYLLSFIMVILLLLIFIIMINIICYVNVIFFFKSLSQSGLNSFHIYISDFFKYIFNIIVEFYCW